MTRALYLVAGAVFAAVLVLADFAARAETSIAQVRTSWLCPSSQSAQVVKDFSSADETMMPPGCSRVPYPVVFEVLRVLSGPHVDWEQDKYYLVVIKTEAPGEWITVAWPGINTMTDKGA